VCGKRGHLICVIKVFVSKKQDFEFVLGLYVCTYLQKICPSNLAQITSPDRSASQSVTTQTLISRPLTDSGFFKGSTTKEFDDIELGL